MSYEFLAPGAATARSGFEPVARSPMERAARAAGARFEVRDGWNVAVAYASPEAERAAAARTAGWADVSHLGKLELQAAAGDVAAVAAQASGGATLELGRATRAAGAWWCPLTPERALVLCSAADTAALRGRLEEAAAAAPAIASVTEITTKHCALTIAGPLAREVLARFCALDLRPRECPVGALRPGSVAQTPGIVICEAEHRYLVLAGAALGEYLWTVVADAGGHLGGVPVGLDALDPIAEPAEEATAHA
jgi:sarcosine oxidase subunit gamma